MEELVKLLKEMSSQMAQLKEQTKYKDMSRKDRLTEELFQLKLELAAIREKDEKSPRDYDDIKSLNNKIDLYKEEIRGCK